MVLKNIRLCDPSARACSAYLVDGNTELLGVVSCYRCSFNLFLGMIFLGTIWLLLLSHAVFAGGKNIIFSGRGGGSHHSEGFFFIGRGLLFGRFFWEFFG